MYVRFIAHAGIYLEEDGISICIDPWFRDSDLNKPLLKGVLPGYQTIDFQNPPCRDKATDFRPDAVLVSHFHTHHAPLEDIQTLSNNGKKLVLACPVVSKKEFQGISKNLGEYKKNIEIKMFRDGDALKIGHLKIKAFTHTVSQHLGWIIEGKSATVVHITDAAAHKNPFDKRLDPLWAKVKDLKPDLLFLGVAGHARVFPAKEGNFVLEGTSLSAIEGAHLTALLKPKVVSIIGMYNHSLWQKNIEFTVPASVTEEQFAWALSHISGEIKFVPARPGHCYGIGSTELAGEVDSFIKKGA